jgi:riboflavin kinase/FMN adenylyltransferase
MANYTIDWREPPPEGCRHGAVAIGNFDGVHRGHASLIAALRAEAERIGGSAVALTFDPHPLELLRPGHTLPRLSVARDRADRLHELGADHVLTLHTTRDLLDLSAREFFDRVIRERLDARALVEGVNFGFGHNREGNVETLARLCEPWGLPLTVVPPVEIAGRPVSSGRVRSLLGEGKVAEAAEMLGRPYRLRGTVGRGQKRGKALGFPTANLAGIQTLIPRDGVYSARVALEGKDWRAAINVGANPTFGEVERKVEVHLIGFEGDLYGKELAVDFLDRLRETRKFSGVEELVAQLRRDVAEAARGA